MQPHRQTSWDLHSRWNCIEYRSCVRWHWQVTGGVRWHMAHDISHPTSDRWHIYIFFFFFGIRATIHTHQQIQFLLYAGFQSWNWKHNRHKVFNRCCTHSVTAGKHLTNSEDWHFSINNNWIKNLPNNFELRKKLDGVGPVDNRPSTTL